MSDELVVERQAGRDTLIDDVVAAIADVKNAGVADLEPLYHSIDPDALERIVTREETEATSTFAECRFETNGCTVTIDTDLHVTVTCGVHDEGYTA